MKKFLALLCALIVGSGQALAARTSPLEVQTLSGKLTKGAVFTVREARYLPLDHTMKIVVEAGSEDEGVALIDVQTEPTREELADAQKRGETLLGITCEPELLDQDRKRFWTECEETVERQGAKLVYTFVLHLLPEVSNQSLKPLLAVGIAECRGVLFERWTDMQFISFSVPVGEALVVDCIRPEPLLATVFSLSQVRYDEPNHAYVLSVDVMPEDPSVGLADLVLGEIKAYATVPLGAFCGLVEKEHPLHWSVSCQRNGRGLAYELIVYLEYDVPAEEVEVELVWGLSQTLDQANAQSLSTTIPLSAFCVQSQSFR